MDIEFWFDLQEFPQVPQLDEKWFTVALGFSSAIFLGAGAFGETWLCQEGDEQFALKIIHNTLFSKSRILKEVEGLQRVSSPNVVNYIDSGNFKEGNTTFPYIKFEYIPGGSLKKHIMQDRWPNHNELVSITKGILEGLVALHNSAMIHRDLKPENIILRNGNFNEPVVVDLGLIKILDSPEYTLYPRKMGTPPYMAPEQIMGEKPKKATDLWALGIMLYVLATKKHPFYGEYDDRLDLQSALDRLYAGSFPLPVGIPQEIQNLIERFLSPEPYQRGTASRALRELEGVI